ncbi:unnamed protein product [Symbiodinium pilosum]|uniref:PDZ domain-containing protein n=1 Tax=Symbiodinium pilosum TaxID=2952 RepID=A0A812K9P4_SYMPI|nr:unnamed protein product [Symbiodinium pilosum]
MFCHCCAPDDKENGLELAPELKTTPKAYGTLADEVQEPSGRFVAVLTTEAASFGVSVDRSNTACVIVRDVTGGAAAAWNEGNPNHKIQPFDQIVEINGAPCTAEDIASRLEDREAKEVRLTISRPQERTVVLRKPGRLGIDVNYRKTSVKPWIASVGSGLVADWNRNKPELAIVPHDRIMSVNGHSGATDTLLEKLRSSDDTMILTVMHYEA